MRSGLPLLLAVACVEQDVEENRLFLLLISWTFCLFTGLDGAVKR